MRIELPTIATLLASVALGCGGSRPPPVEPTSPFTAADAQVFDEGVDFVTDPTVLEGRWREDWDHSAVTRVQRADLIAVVQVNTLRTDTDPDQQTTYRIVADVQKAILGHSPTSEMTLPVERGDSGYAAVSSNQQRILDHGFILFVKWYRDAQGEVAAHFHLSPATNPISARVHYLIGRAHPEVVQGTRRVIIQR